LKSKTWIDPKHKNAYAFTFIKRSEIFNFYNAKLQDLSDKASQKIREAEQIQNNASENAFLRFQQGESLFREMEEANAILIGIEKKNHANDLLRLEQRARQGIDEIEGGVSSSIEGAAFKLSTILKKQLKSKDPISVFPLSFQDTKMMSQFSARLVQNMQSKLATAGLLVDVKATSNLILDGSYWKEANFLRLIIICRELNLTFWRAPK
jgi:hypothetical protein